MQPATNRSFTPGWRLCAALTILAAAHGNALAAPPPAAEAINVVFVAGDVRVTMNGATQALKAGVVIVPPAEIRTGRDGFVELRQARTRMSVAADSQLGIPASSSRGALIERVLQARGNVFYDVAPRSGSKLKVQTPYLVASIKGTQFNVAANADSATVSLFEGRLEVWSSDGGDVVQLDAGEIATRGDADEAIRVLLMNTGELLRAGVAPNLNRVERGDAQAAESAEAESPTPPSAAVADASPARPGQRDGASPEATGLVADLTVTADVVVAPTQVAAIGAPPLVLDAVVPAPVAIGVTLDPVQAPLADSSTGGQRPVSLNFEPVGAPTVSPPGLELNRGLGPPISPPGLDLNPGLGPPISPPGLELERGLGPPISPPGLDLAPVIAPVGKGRSGQ